MIYVAITQFSLSLHFRAVYIYGLYMFDQASAELVICDHVMGLGE